MTKCTPPDDDRCKFSEDAAKSAVKQVFAILGVDIDDPAAVEDFRKDLRFGGMMRKASDNGFVAVVVMAVTAMGVAAWAGITARWGWSSCKGVIEVYNN